MLNLVVRKETARRVKVKNEWHCTLVMPSLQARGQLFRSFVFIALVS